MIGTPYETIKSMTERSLYMNNMVDVSSNNHPNNALITWDALAQQGIKFAMVKISEGTDYVNLQARSDISSAQECMIAVGGYHFAKPSSHVAAEHEAEFFVANANDRGIRWRYALDLETTGGLTWAELNDWALAFLNRMYQLTGQHCVFYSNPYYLECLREAPWGRPLWLAEPSATVMPRKALWAWQHEPIRMQGCHTLIDVSTYYG